MTEIPFWIQASFDPIFFEYLIKNFAQNFGLEGILNLGKQDMIVFFHIRFATSQKPLDGISSNSGF